MEIVNWRLLRHPMNWVTVFVWMLFFGMAILIIDPVLPHPPSSPSNG